MELWHLSVLALSITAALCIVGVLAPAYQDNFVQRLGMFALCYGCATRVQHIWMTERISIDWLWVHCGMALYALGTAYKQCRKH